MTVLRLCVFGDSIANGTGDTAYLGWPGRLCAVERARGHDLTCYNLGVRGDTSREIAARWQAEARARLPDHLPGALVFAFGINDTALEGGKGPRVRLGETLATARAILGAAKTWRRTLWIGPTPMQDGLSVGVPGGPQYGFDAALTALADRAYGALAREIGVAYLDLHGPLAGDPRWRRALAAGDGIHPSADGYALLAETVGRWAAWRAWLD